MNSKDMRKYWVNKYEEVTGQTYPDSEFIVDLVLLKRLITKYNEYVVLEAIDRFLENNKVKHKTIKYLCSKNFFNERFYDIINEQEVIKYKRLYRSNPQVKELINEYQNYIDSISLSDSEKERKKEILETLRDLEKTINESTRT